MILTKYELKIDYFLDDKKIPEVVFQRDKGDVWYSRTKPFLPEYPNEKARWSLSRQGDAVRVLLLPVRMDGKIVTVAMAIVDMLSNVFTDMPAELSDVIEIRFVFGDIAEKVDGQLRLWIGIAIKTGGPNG